MSYHGNSSIKRVSYATCLWLLLLGFASTGQAQTTISYYSKLSNHGAVPAQCLMAGDALTARLNKFPHPGTWTYIVICDDRSWDDVMAANRQTQSNYIHGATDRDHHTTMLRGTTLRDDSHTNVTSDHVVAHELCHIYLSSDDEVAVDALALALAGVRRSEQVVAVVAETAVAK